MRWDLVLVDEAHKMAAYRYGTKVNKTQRYEFGEFLRDRTDHYLFLTATPHKGDPDNFAYPRYDLDFAVLRVYENDRPIQVKDYLKWNTKGADEGDLIFVSGHPGSTARGLTVSQLALNRDLIYPLRIGRFKRQLQALRAYSARGSEQARQAADDGHAVQRLRRPAVLADCGGREARPEVDAEDPLGHPLTPARAGV